ncbi:cell envelope biogenesis protein TolA [Mesorhizobium sp. IMUNJ 23033]|uniref:cell envelope biogenesis protein TolA n=1 Tax=Mesorhizobium sp. IMUNJ 23033 TaxID=3378039 RepID=UPI00384FF2AB
MAKKLKVYQTSIGFFELAVAAPSMKAAAEAWGSDPDIFKRGFAKQTEDPKVVEATIATPGVVLRRPVGSHGEFTEKAMLPKAPEGRRRVPEDRAKPADASKKADTKSNEKLELKAAAALEKERKREALDRSKAEAERERAKKQRERMIAKANAAFERARSRHEDTVDSIRQRRVELDKEEAHENERWEREQQEHDDAMKETKA